MYYATTQGAVERHNEDRTWTQVIQPSNARSFTETQAIVDALNATGDQDEQQRIIAAAQTAQTTSFHVYYLNQRIVIEAKNEGEAMRIAAQQWNTTTRAVKAFPIHQDTTHP